MKQLIVKHIVNVLLIQPKKLFKRGLMYFIGTQFNTIGHNVIFDPFDSFSYDTISVGNNVFIGSGAKFSATESYILIGNKVMFGPNVTIMGGDHKIDVIGKYMFDVKNKDAKNDQPVIIEDDVWIATNVTILKGVTIGKGAVIAANALVINDVDSYSIMAGQPAKILRNRFTQDEIRKHQKKIENENP